MDRVPCNNDLTGTGKSLSEALIFASNNLQYDDRLFIELRVQYMWIASSEHGDNMGRTCCVHKLFVFLFWHSAQHVLPMFWACKFSCTELVKSVQLKTIQI